MTDQERLIKLCNIREVLREAERAIGPRAEICSLTLAEDLGKALADINYFILEEKNGSTRET